MTRYDVVVIGGGAAGLSAALVLSRARRTVLVIDAGTPRNAPAAHMHGFLSRDGHPPGELLATGRNEVKGYGGEIVAGTVTDLGPEGRSGFRVHLAGGQETSARRLLVTTGLRERWARDVLHCPYCPGHEVRDRRLGVIGGAPGAVRYAQIVRQWTDDLVYFTPPDALTSVERSELAARAVDQLRGVRMDDGRVVSRDWSGLRGRQRLLGQRRHHGAHQRRRSLGCRQRRRPPRAGHHGRRCRLRDAVRGVDTEPAQKESP